MFRAVWPYLGVLGFFNFLALKLLPRHARTRAILDQIALRLPLVAAATRATAQACFVRTVGILMRTGALLGEAMAIAAYVAKPRARRGKPIEGRWRAGRRPCSTL